MFRVLPLRFALCVPFIWIGLASPLNAQQEFFPLDQPDNIFRDSTKSDTLRPELSRELVAEPLPLQSRSPLNDEFNVGILSTGQASRRSPDGGGPPGQDRSPFKSRVFWIPARPVDGQSGDLGISGEEFDFGIPLRIDDNGIWLAMGGVQRLDINTSVLLPDSGLSVPNQLWDIEGGLMHIRELGDERQAGGMLRVGSPSDHPFEAWRDLTVTFLSFLTIPARNQDAWSFSLFYSPTGQIIYPIPGVAYVWRPNDRLRANLGIPFSLEYKPTETSVFTASYMPLNNVQVLLRQSLGQSWSVYSSYRTSSETFLLANRDNDRDRTYLFDQRMSLGLQRKLGRGWSVDLSVAYVFDRQFFQAQKFSGNRRDELSIDSGVAGILQVIWNR